MTHVLFVGAIHVPLKERVSLVTVCEASVFLGSVTGRLSLFDTNMQEWKGQWTSELARSKKNKKYTLMAIAARSHRSVAFLESRDSEIFCSETTVREKVVTSTTHRLATTEMKTQGALDASRNLLLAAYALELFLFSGQEGVLRLDRRFKLGSSQLSISCVALKNTRFACAVGNEVLLPAESISLRCSAKVQQLVWYDSSLLTVATADGLVSAYHGDTHKVCWRVTGASRLYLVSALDLLFDDRREDNGFIRVYDAPIPKKNTNNASVDIYPTLLCDQSLASSATDGTWRSKVPPLLLATAPQPPHNLQRLVVLHEPKALLLLTLRPRFSSLLPAFSLSNDDDD